MVAGGVLLALAVLGLVRTAQWALTPLLLGVLFGLALDPVVAILRARLRCSRAVATLVISIVLTVVFGAVVLLLGPQAVQQAGEFAEELPATVEEFYSWPLIGQRLKTGRDRAGRGVRRRAPRPVRHRHHQRLGGPIARWLGRHVARAGHDGGGAARRGRARAPWPQAGAATRRAAPTLWAASCTNRSPATSPVRSRSRC